jgi:fluoride exporter
MNWAVLGFVALGGAFGSVARAVIGKMIPDGQLPWATILINVSGSLLIGWLMGKLGPITPENMRLHGFAVVGICGGFTTFSAFSWQTIDQLQKGQWAPAMLNVLLSVALCLLATWLGLRLAR